MFGVIKDFLPIKTILFYVSNEDNLRIIAVLAEGEYEGVFYNSTQF